ncbi:hypothetical protein GLOTRDRAFT_117105 [Gloeophyllum trabeum ATCC 11539]|uniref:Uncharacterized protein n=1 Tax=Gloeophyllum trabeum (strain ATCC 11539 / FP-39264 / Madison 617) TaxID=670483 RepID=S7Q077_GLOTA|nr:uncharacterized protein GLOTRDRAFT_117105 [Gloeophyllum trabeum ATCC 11539]EPQ52927.1 hypothetical protein GLOTRDRAFT_117105 [Gloeophyllum trabeum ATCC 11539]
MTGSQHFKVGRVGHAGSHYNKVQKQKRDTCSSGGFYKSPSGGDTIDVSSSDKFNMTWDTSCLNSTAVDIYLYAPGSTSSLLHVWEKVNFKNGNYDAELKPKWWNATSSVKLQLAIVNSGDPPFLATMPAGPIFSAKYISPSSGSTPAFADTSALENTVEVVNNFDTPHHGPSKGGIAAAVIFPLLVVALGVAAYIKFSRERGKEKRKRWSEAVDKRMSTISTDWKSISAAGATAAIRNSIAVNNRASSFSFGGGQAGVGAQGLYTHENAPLGEDGVPQMSQLRPGVRASAYTSERVSRVSFAADTRPSGEHSRRSLATSRAFHSSFVPPVPQRTDTGMTADSEPLSPTQKAGPMDLTADEIEARISGGGAAPRPSVDVLPALSMMRTGANADGDNDYILSPTSQAAELPTPPTPSYLPPKSPIMGAMPMQPMPASVMSPDEMLRAYAESRKAGNGTPSLPGSPAPAFPTPSYNGSGMRTLYSPPATPATSQPLMAQFSGETNPFRISMAVASEHSKTSLEGRHSHEQDGEGSYDMGSAR